MSDQYENREELAGKIALEGGILESFAYGIRSTDMPEGDDELTEAWRALEEAYAVADRAASKIRKLLPEDAEL